MGNGCDDEGTKVMMITYGEALLLEALLCIVFVGIGEILKKYHQLQVNQNIMMEELKL